MKTKNLIYNNRKYISELINNINKCITGKDIKINVSILTKIINNLDYCGINEKEIGNVKGDIWEIFGEHFLTYCQDDINDFKNYELLNNKFYDYGVDAIALNINNHKTVIQHKFRSSLYKNEHNSNSMLTYGDISRTHTQGTFNLNYELREPSTIVLFTNVDESLISYEITKFFGDVVNVISKKNIDKRVENNYHFWENFYNNIIEVMKNDGII